MATVPHARTSIAVGVFRMPVSQPEHPTDRLASQRSYHEHFLLDRHSVLRYTRCRQVDAASGEASGGVTWLSGHARVVPDPITNPYERCASFC